MLPRPFGSCFSQLLDIQFPVAATKAASLSPQACLYTAAVAGGRGEVKTSRSAHASEWTLIPQGGLAVPEIIFAAQLMLTVVSIFGCRRYMPMLVEAGELQVFRSK